ncbi:UvrD-like helicase C-terminal domain-containing protein [Aspergillus coremiiformis]|uniref:UvrD-like helicase C-terminal domain-containing protein n=1 Tax=Aspergillus coremiiformis TaxID=138285 RepID=A0A5N6Z3V1_9EURO|nr:UvrD-like helicase C-terminal domain-containing protein [Aspergillus coremiiformis]
MLQLYSDTSVVLLEDNYRSSGSILSSAQDVIEQDSSRPAKRLQPTHSVGTMPVLRKLPTAEAEAQWIVLEIKRCVAMTGQLLKYSDFAILLRSAALSRQIESEMGKQGMPYRMVGGLRFFDRVEIKLLLDYLRVISQPGNTDTLLRIINVPSRKIGDETIRSLLSGAEKANRPLWDFVKDVAQGRRSTEKSLSKPTNHGLCTFVGLIESSRQKLLECSDSSAPKKLLEFVIKKLSFREYLTSTYGTNEENKWANSSGYTMNGSNFSAPTTMSLGFSTAREYIATNTAARQEQKPGTGFENKPKVTGPGSSGRKVDGLSQKSISGFFSKPSSQPQQKSIESAPAHCHTPPGNGNDVIGQAIHSRNVLPTNSSTYRPQAQRLQTARPILEPSDPNRYTWLATSSAPTGKPILHSGEKGKEMSDKGNARREWATSEIKRAEEPVGSIRPAATYHTTTMSMLQGGAPVPMRRTLGIRRSMNGWEERMKRAGNQRS